MSGPSEKALEALAERKNRAKAMRCNVSAEDLAEAMHDPDLGIDRSVCLSDVINALHKADEIDGTSDGHLWANFIYERFT